MKKIFLSLFIAGFLFSAGVVSAQMGMMGNYQQNSSYADTNQNAEIRNALQDIYSSQNISNRAEVECAKVTDGQFEKLGDAYMEIMVPNENQHEAMDSMMGGEGSISLRQAHINMGRSYLGCWSNYDSGPVYMPMMGNMMGGTGSYAGGYGWGPGMYGSFAWPGLITMILVWILLILGIIALIKWIRK